MVELALHDLGDLELERLDRALGGLRLPVLVAPLPVDVQLALGDVRNVVVLEVENALRVLDDGSSIRSDEELDGLRKAVLRHEGTGL